MTEDGSIARFVDAADKLVNLLNGPAPTRPSARRHHESAVDAAMDEYDAARRAVTGEFPGEDED